VTTVAAEEVGWVATSAGVTTGAVCASGCWASTAGRPVADVATLAVGATCVATFVLGATWAVLATAAVSDEDAIAAGVATLVAGATLAALGLTATVAAGAEEAVATFVAGVT
jgi:hypothetical protein